MKKKHDLVDLSVEVLRHSDRAALVSTGDPNKAEWVPLSQCELVSDGNGRTHTLTCPQWLAEEKGLV